MKQGMKRTGMGGVLALLLFGVFAVCILMVLLTGADIYQRLTQRDQGSYDRRTAAQYITTRVRQADTQGRITIEEFGGTSALVIREDIEGESYLTRVYCWDGYIQELFSAQRWQFGPEDGEPILEAAGLSFALEDGLLTVCLQYEDGTQEQLYLALRSQGEVVS